MLIDSSLLVDLDLDCLPTTRQAALDTLSNLAASPLQYHIDDDPADVFDCDDSACETLAEVVDKCFELLGNEVAWEHYHAQCEKINAADEELDETLYGR